jgi:hypothetical protein
MDNGKYIDLWHTQVGYGEPLKDKEWHAAMKRIRRTHICMQCKKYPGDSEYLMGLKDDCGTYTCFDCL